MQSDTYKQRCIPTVEQIHTNHRNFTADWPWSGTRHLCLLRWCAWTVLTSLCVCVCAHWCTLHMNCVLRCWCPPAPCCPITGSGRLFGRYILSGKWQEMSLSNSPKRRGWESAAWGRGGSSLNSCLSNSPSTRKISLPLVTKSFPAPLSTLPVWITLCHPPPLSSLLFL